jgi:hypothetical protein
LFDDMPVNQSLTTLCLLVAISALNDGGSCQINKRNS